MLKKLAVVLFAGLLTGCSARKPVKQPVPLTFSVVVPRQCIEALELTPDTYCRGVKMEKLTCYRMKMQYKKNCESLHVGPD